jgi:cytoskeletal protein CcmA (bactofilin family)
MRITRVVGVGILLGLVFWGVIYGQGVKAAEWESGDEIIIAEDQVVDDDLYIFGNTVEIHGKIKGDLVATGSKIIIGKTAVIEEDLIAAGQSLEIAGSIADDLRFAGAVISIIDSASINDDVLTAGYSLEMSSGSKIGGDLVFYGNQVIMDGTVEGDGQISAVGIEINGSIKGSLNADVGAEGDMPPISPMQFIPNMPAIPSVSGGLTLGSDAEIIGDFHYTSPEEAEFDQTAISGEVLFKQSSASLDEEDTPSFPTASERFTGWILTQGQRFVSLMFIGFLLVLITPKFLDRTSEIVQRKIFQCLGWGLVIYFFFFFIILLVLIISVILAILFSSLKLPPLSFLSIIFGLVLAFNIGLIFYISNVFITKALVGYMVGKTVFNRVVINQTVLRIISLAFGLIIYVGLTGVRLPVFSQVINMLVIFAGLGAMFLYAREWVVPRD